MKISSAGSEHPDFIWRVGGSNPLPKNGASNRPQTKKHFKRSAFFYSISNVFSNAIPREPLIKIKLFEGIFDFKKPEKSSKVLKNFK